MAVVVAAVMVQAVIVAKEVGLSFLWSCCIAVAMVEKMGMERTKAGIVCDATARYIYLVLVDAPHEGLSEPALACWENAIILFCTTRPRSEGHTCVRAG